ncbi:T9SS type A sorting domain-containing protein [Hymenobacter sp. H14-R3]|nr:T9SS type A sorting domain-containing protein [Hymenobacter sp. H14-R3]MDJ0367667.1 T9SS type A sorting domain-containing protein [Hymenobacter sp. H14-R3]
MLYPNPSQGGAVQLSRPISGALHDLTGRPVRQLATTNQLETSGLAAGIYVLRATDGATSKLVVR